MKRPELIWLVPLLLVAAVFSIYIYQRSAPGKSPSDHRPLLAPGVQIGLEGTSRVTSSEKGVVGWTMTSQALRYFADQKWVGVDAPHSLVTLREGGTVEVSGDSGAFYQDSQDMDLEGAVSVAMERGGRLEWAISGDTAGYHKADDAFTVTGLSGEMYQESGDTVKIRGRRGGYENRVRVMRLEQEVEIDLYRQGRLEWELTGDTASYHERDQVFHLSDMNGLFHHPDGSELELRGDRASFDSRGKEMEVTGKVDCQWSQGIRLETERIKYNSETEVASTEAAVKVTGKGWTLTGVGMRADMKTERIVVKKSVEIRLEKGLSGIKE